jgi:outer membrane lipoprotein SlyB
MEVQSTPRTSLHPLVATAAVAVTLASLVGIAAMTGILPKGTAKPVDSPLVAQAVPAPTAAPQPTVAAAPVVAPEPVPTPKPVAKPVVKTAPKHVQVAHRSAPVQDAPVQVVQTNVPPPGTYPAIPPDYRPLPQPQPQVEAPYPTVVAAAKPSCADCGTVESMREFDSKGEGTGLGAVAGGLGGLVLGHQVGKGTGNAIATVLGAAGGAIAGHQIEKNARKTKSYEISVRMEDGGYRTITSATAPAWRTGDHVRVVNGTLQADNR